MDVSCVTGCRMPGDINCPDDFKKVMEEGIDVISEIPSDRWDMDKYWHPDPHNVGTHANKRAGFCKNVHDFDHTFYNISPREAANMDVMQRHILEVTQESLDDAGIPSEKLPRDTGVYVGICLMDHGFTVIEDAKCMNAYTHTGTAHSVAANRVSFAYDIRGPSVAIDTACAASLTSMHYACFALWNKECPVALVTASNTLMVPEVTVGFSALGVLSPEGVSCPFSANAKGYVRSEGTGSLVMKPLQDAQRDGDHIYCTVRASWLAHNGFSLSITMPSTDAQAEMMKRTYEVFGFDRENTDFIEAHGTGTPVGDPLEAEGIARAFTLDSKRKTPLAVGSSKSNFGHMEGAAGMVQVIKTALMLENRCFYPNINYGIPNPAIDVDNWNIYVPEAIVPFKEKKAMRIGVNTFGFGGALAHMLFEEYKGKQPIISKNKGKAGWKFGNKKKGLKLPIPLSAKSSAALRSFCEKWQQFESNDDAQEVVSWLATRRSHYNTRLLVFADSGEDFKNKMQMYIDKTTHEDIVEGVLPAHVEEKKICFVFPGQGQQSFDMGRTLYVDEPVFRKAVDDCDAIYKKLSGKSFCHTYNLFVPLQPGKKYNPDVVNEIQVSQPAILFLQVGLYELIIHWGIKPDALVGHSLGEVAAAYASGAVNLEEAVTVQYHRAEQQVRLDGTGSMAALRVSAEEGEKMCKNYKDLYVACNNAQGSITIAGSKPVIKQICEDNPGNAKELRVKCAFHTPHMDPLEKDFMKAMKGKLRNGKATGAPWYSTVTGYKYDGPANAQYFWDNIRSRVQFLGAVQGVLRDFQNVVFLELAGAATLLSSIRQIAKNDDVTPAGMVPCGQRKIDDRISTLRAMANLHSMGIEIDWTNVTGDCGHWMRLPLYAWQHQTFRYEAEGMRSRRLDLEDRTYKGLHGMLRLEQLPVLRDHVVNGQLVFPRSGFVEYMLQHNFDDEALPALSNIQFKPEFIALPEEVDLNGEIPERKQLSIEDVQIQNGHRSEILCDGMMYACGDIVPVKGEVATKSFNISTVKSRCKVNMTADEFYEVFGEMGVEYADFMRFKAVEEAYIGDGEALASLYPAIDKRERLYTPLLDAAFTVAMAAHVNNTTLLTPSKIGTIRMTVPKLARKEKHYVYARLSNYDSYGIKADIYIMNENGEVLAEIQGFEAQNTKNVRTANVDLSQCIYTTEWQPIKACMPPTSVINKFFSQKNMQKLYPTELVAIENAENYSQLMKEICAAYARNAVETTPENQYHQKMERYAKRLRQMADTIPSSMTYEQLPKYIEKINKECPEYFQETLMIERMGRVMPEALKDPKHALVELFTEEMMAAYFIDSITTRIYYKMLGDAVRKAVEHALQSKKIVRVLEVGGRLGGMTKYILPCIEEYLKQGTVEYCFTDINVAFFNLVQEKLADFPNVRYQQFDPENDIVSQQFVPNSFDLVVCLDTLHCTENAVHATSNIRDLLCDDGWLAVMESTNNHNTPEIIFGAFDLCWIFEDERVDRCWMSQAGWTGVMQKAGFSDVVAVSTPNEFYHSLLIGRKTNMELFYEINKPKEESAEESEVVKEEGDAHVVLVHGKDKSIAVMLKGLLSKHCELVNVAQFSQMQRSLSTKTSPLSIVYFLEDNDTDLKETLTVMQACQHLGERPLSALWVVTRGAHSTNKALDLSAATGFVRAAISEVKNLAIYMVDIGDGAINGQMTDLLGLLKNHTHTDRELYISESNHLVPRVIKQPFSTKLPLEGSDWRVEVTSLRDNLIDKVDFHKTVVCAPTAGHVKIAVNAAAVNRRDVSAAQCEDRTCRKQFGMECAGIVQSVGAGVSNVSAGDSVFAFGTGCMASHINIDSKYVFKKPQQLSMVDAGGFGVAYATAYYALADRAALREGETVLVHSACSGEGQALIQIAKYMGATPICVAETDAERKQLQSECRIAHVTSVDTFHDDVMEWTSGLGVDVAITLSESTVEKSVHSLAHGGRLCHLGANLTNAKLLMDMLNKNASVHAIQIEHLMMQNQPKFRDIVESVLEMFEQGAISALPVNVQDMSEVVTALTKDNTYIGDIVLDIPARFSPDVEPAIETFKPDVTYLVTGSSGGVGQEIARWLADKGARHIAVASKNGHKSWFQKNTIKYVEDHGVTVYDIRVDLSKEKGVRELFRLLSQNGTPPVKGIFHLAGLNQDTELENITSQQMSKEMKVRARGAQFLNDVTSDLNLTLDYFVTLSSSKVAWGSPNLASFCASCSYLDQLAECRRHKGQAALSVQCGWLRGAGWLEDRTRNGSLQQFYNSSSLHISEFLAILHKLLDQPDLPPVIMVSNEVGFPIRNSL